jgi:hypothetical protein
MDLKIRGGRLRARSVRKETRTHWVCVTGIEVEVAACIPIGMVKDE